MSSEVKLVNGRITVDEFKAKFPKYQSPEICPHDVSDALLAFTSLKPYARECIQVDGSLAHMLNLEGTIPIRYKSQMYNIPVRIVLQHSHPTTPPIVYVVPTGDMIVRKGSTVHDDGKVILSQITNWKSNPDLTALLHTLCVKFGECAPLWTKRSHVPPQAAHIGGPPSSSANSMSSVRADSPLHSLGQLRVSLPPPAEVAHREPIASPIASNPARVDSVIGQNRHMAPYSSTQPSELPTSSPPRPAPLPAFSRQSSGSGMQGAGAMPQMPGIPGSTQSRSIGQGLPNTFQEFPRQSPGRLNDNMPLSGQYHPGAPRQGTSQRQPPTSPYATTIAGHQSHYPNAPIVCTLYEPLYHPNSTYTIATTSGPLSAIVSPQTHVSSNEYNGRRGSWPLNTTNESSSSLGHFLPLEPNDDGRFHPDSNMMFTKNQREHAPHVQDRELSQAMATSMASSTPNLVYSQHEGQRSVYESGRYNEGLSKSPVPPSPRALPVYHQHDFMLFSAATQGQQQQQGTGSEIKDHQFISSSSQNVPPTQAQGSSYGAFPIASLSSNLATSSSGFVNDSQYFKHTGMATAHEAPTSLVGFYSTQTAARATSIPIERTQQREHVQQLSSGDVQHMPASRLPHQPLAKAPFGALQGSSPSTSLGVLRSIVGRGVGVGQELIQDHEVIKLLGRGGFAEVYLLKNKTTGEQVAAKVVNLGGNSPDVQKNVKALQKDIAILKSLSNPYIIGYRTAVEYLSDIHNLLAMVIDYMPGGSIYQRVCNGTPIDEGNCRVFTWQILRGLDYLHEKGFIHRDIKGRNILIGENDMIKIADFGISKNMEDLATTVDSRSSTNLASVFWTSPEMVAKQSPDERTDIWSLGCTVVEMLYCKPPLQLEGLNSVQAIYRITQHNVAPPEDCSKVTRSFLELCFKRKVDRPTAKQLLSQSEFPRTSPSK